jgi:hypothetical protein
VLSGTDSQAKAAVRGQPQRMLDDGAALPVRHPQLGRLQHPGVETHLGQSRPEIDVPLFGDREQVTQHARLDGGRGAAARS